MKRRPLVIALSLGLGLMMGLAFRYQVTSLRREERRQTWLAYVRGPLKLYVSGSRQGADLLKMEPLPAARRMALADAIQDLHDSWTQAVAQQQAFQADAFFEDLDQVVSWHGAASSLADSWPRLDPGNHDEMRDARLGAEGIHRNLALKVNAQWSRTSEEVPWSPQEKKECQDVIQALSEPLP